MRINENGVYDNIGLLDSVVQLINSMDLQGVKNWTTAIDCIQRLDSLRKALVKEGEQREADNDQQG